MWGVMSATQRKDGGVYLGEGGWGERGFWSAISQQMAPTEPCWAPTSNHVVPVRYHAGTTSQRGFFSKVGFDNATLIGNMAEIFTGRAREIQRFSGSTWEGSNAQLVPRTSIPALLRSLDLCIDPSYIPLSDSDLEDTE